MKKSDWKKIRNEYEHTDITQVDLAKTYGIKLNTLSMHRKRNNWKKKSNVHTHITKNVNVNKMSRNNFTKLKSVDDVEQSNLTEKQKMFCMFYLKYHNGTKAYQKAYDCSYDSANKNASTLMVNKGVQSLLHKLHARQSQDLYLDSTDILKEYAKQAFADIGDAIRFGHKTAYDDNGEKYQQTYMYLANSDEIDTSLLQDVSVGGSSGKKVQMYDKQKALKILLDYLPKPDKNSGKPLPLFENIMDHMQKDKHDKK